MYRGIDILDPFGVTRKVFPMLFSYNCDYPESSKVTCTFSGVKSQKPCSLCLCPTRDIADPKYKISMRTEVEQKGWLENTLLLSMNEKLAEQAAMSTVLVKVSFLLWTETLVTLTWLNTNIDYV